MFWKLLEKYVTEAWVFCLMHVVLTAFIIPYLVGFARWNPSAGHTRPSWESLEIRSQFIRGLIGLYLLIGISGTFYGLFEFAVHAQADDASIRAALTAAIAKAFPVGFVGLIAGLVFHVAVDVIERRKLKAFESIDRNDAAELGELVRNGFVATERAVSDQTERLGAGFVKLAVGIQAALRPVEALQETLGQTLEPVVKRLGESLDMSTSLLKDQGDRLEAGKEALIEASKSLSESANRVESSFAEIGTVTKEAQKALKQARALCDQSTSFHTESLRSLNEHSTLASSALEEACQLFSKARVELEETGVGLRQIPGQLETRLADQAKTFAVLATGQIKGDFEKLYVDAASHLTEAFNQIGEQLSAYNEQVREITRDVEDVTANFHNTQSLLVGAIDDGIRKQSEDYGREIKTHVDRVFGPFEAADKGVGDFQNALAGFVTGLHAMDSGHRGIVESHREALAKLDRMSDGLSQAPAAAARQREQLESLLRECLAQLKSLPTPAVRASAKPVAPEQTPSGAADMELTRTSIERARVTQFGEPRKPVSPQDPAKEPASVPTRKSWLQRLRSRFMRGSGQ